MEEKIEKIFETTSSSQQAYFDKLFKNVEDKLNALQTKINTVNEQV